MLPVESRIKGLRRGAETACQGCWPSQNRAASRQRTVGDGKPRRVTDLMPTTILIGLPIRMDALQQEKTPLTKSVEWMKLEDLKKKEPNAIDRSVQERQGELISQDSAKVAPIAPQ
ncbi:hypothetical protein LJB71_13495 [Thermomonas sp. S9]|uniref:hypothetical protein n=1 Tax=Thermomonas sp. S9 TaxID=2885203 RepID=UPI00216B25D0|nr:hypothetical protein [Thermomonas sp. S9]MCR6497139.1 hypothetical protein [Thermomonas sp. S9]